MKSFLEISDGSAMPPKRLGEILDHGFTVLKRSLPPLAVVLVLFAAIDTAEPLFWSGDLPAKLLGILLNIIQWFVGLSFVFLLGAEWQGRPISLGQAMKKTTFSFVLKATALSIVVGIMTALCSILLVIPGIIYFLNRVLAFTCIYFEEVNVAEALSRSKFLMTQEKWYSLKGPKMRYLGLILVTIILSVVVGGGGALFMGAADAYISAPFSTPVIYATQFTGALLLHILSLYTWTVAVGFYFDLRARYEALDLMESPE